MEKCTPRSTVSNILTLSLFHFDFAARSFILSNINERNMTWNCQAIVIDIRSNIWNSDEHIFNNDDTENKAQATTATANTNSNCFWQNVRLKSNWKCTSYYFSHFKCPKTEKKKKIIVHIVESNSKNTETQRKTFFRSHGQRKLNTCFMFCQSKCVVTLSTLIFNFKMRTDHAKHPLCIVKFDGEKWLESLLFISNS